MPFRHCIIYIMKECRRRCSMQGYHPGDLGGRLLPGVEGESQLFQLCAQAELKRQPTQEVPLHVQLAQRVQQSHLAQSRDQSSLAATTDISIWIKLHHASPAHACKKQAQRSLLWIFPISLATKTHVGQCRCTQNSDVLDWIAGCFGMRKCTMHCPTPGFNMIWPIRRTNLWRQRRKTVASCRQAREVAQSEDVGRYLE